MSVFLSNLKRHMHTTVGLKVMLFDFNGLEHWKT